MGRLQVSPPNNLIKLAYCININKSFVSLGTRSACSVAHLDSASGLTNEIGRADEREGRSGCPRRSPRMSICSTARKQPAVALLA